MKITPNIMFKSNAREAFQAYAAILKADRLDLITFGDMPGVPVGPEWQDKIAHAWMQVGDQAIMGSDSPTFDDLNLPGDPTAGGCAEGAQTGDAPGSVAVHYDEIEEARRVFDALAEGGTVQMPFAATDWSPGFGMARDRFGKDWMINTNPQNPS